MTGTSHPIYSRQSKLFYFGLSILGALVFVHASTTRAGVYIATPLAIYHFESTSTDATSNAYNMVASGTLSYGAGVFGNAIRTSSGSVSIGNDLGVAAGDITISTWAKSLVQPQTNTRQGMIANQDGATNTKYTISYLDIDGTKSVIFTRRRESVVECDVRYDTNIGTSTFHLFTLTQSSTVLKGYIDGVEVGSNSTCSGSGSGNTTEETSVGRIFGGAGDAKAGSFDIDDVGVWSRALTQSEIDSIWNSGAGAELCSVSDCSATVLTFATGTLGQYKSDGTTAIPSNGTTTESIVVFKATLNSTATSTVQLQIEIQSAGTSFTDTASVTSTFVSPGNNASATKSGLSVGEYHWQARIVDSFDRSSVWVTPSTPAAGTDFSVQDFMPDGVFIGTPRAVYHFDSNILDATANDYDMIWNQGSSTPSYVTGKFSNALQTSKTGDSWAYVGDDMGVNASDIFMSVWGKLMDQPSTNTRHGLVANQNAISDVKYTISAIDINNVKGVVFTRRKEGIAECDVLYNIDLGLTNWHLFNLAWSSTTNILTGYLDGAQVGTAACSGSGSGSTDLVTSAGRIFGGAGDANTGSWNIDDFGVWTGLSNPSSSVSLVWNASSGKVLCVNSECSSTSTPSSYYAPIKSTTNGRWLLRSTPASSTDSNWIKRLPEDWVVYVSSTVSATGTPIVADGYRWFKVVDKTDNVEGWMAATSSSATFLTYTSSTQSALQATSSNYVATSSRPDVILNAIDHFYNDTSTSLSLYSSDDGTNDISVLKNRGYEKAIIWGVAARESGPNFNNDIVSFDYGHGIMQLTFQAWSHEPTSTGNWIDNAWDNRGVGSWVKIYPCESVATSTYIKCYTYGGEQSTSTKSYKQYDDNASNPTYKQYGNTFQSIYANVKDGLRILQNEYNEISTITTSTTVGTTTYSGVQRETILATEGYNGSCGYVDLVATRLDTIDSYFPGMTSSTVSSTVQKMHTAGRDVICAQLDSPADVGIQDVAGRFAGVTDGRGRSDFEWALYDKEKKWVKVLFPEEDNYVYKVIGTGTGTYRLTFVLKSGLEFVTFKIENVPITLGETHHYTFDRATALSKSGQIELRIDTNGDSEFDKKESLQPVFVATGQEKVIRYVPDIISIVPELFVPVFVAPSSTPNTPTSTQR